MMGDEYSIFFKCSFYSLKVMMNPTYYSVILIWCLSGFCRAVVIILDFLCISSTA